MLVDAQCSDQSLWASVWDYQRYALYELGEKEAAIALCERSIETLSKITLWDYLAEFNPIRHALRAMHNLLAYQNYETAKELTELKKGLDHSNKSFSIISPIEDEEALNPFYETKALLLHRAKGFDQKYDKELERTLSKIKKLKLQEEGVLSEEFLKIFKW